MEVSVDGHCRWRFEKVSWLVFMRKEVCWAVFQLRMANTWMANDLLSYRWPGWSLKRRFHAGASANLISNLLERWMRDIGVFRPGPNGLSLYLISIFLSVRCAAACPLRVRRISIQPYSLALPTQSQPTPGHPHFTQLALLLGRYYRFGGTTSLRKGLSLVKI